MRVLVVKMSSMGDVVHALPMATDIGRHLPGASIHWVCEAPFAPIPAMNPAVSEVIPIAWRKWRRRLGDPEVRAAMAAFRDRLRAVRYDWVIDCQGLIKSAVVGRIARATRRAGLSWSSAREPIASLAYDLKADVPRSWHVVARNRAVAAAAFGYALDDRPRFGLAPPRYAPAWLRAAVGASTSDGGYAVLVTGASRPQKLWPDAHWIAIGGALLERGLRLVWLWGSEAERARARTLAAACGPLLDVREPGEAGAPGAHAARCVVPPFLGVAEVAGLLAGSELVVGLDTGFTHLAGALGRPTVGIFCDFDAVQCAVTGDGFCASFGGVGRVPSAAEIQEASVRALASRDADLSPPSS